MRDICKVDIANILVGHKQIEDDEPIPVGWFPLSPPSDISLIHRLTSEGWEVLQELPQYPAQSVEPEIRRVTAVQFLQELTFEENVGMNAAERRVAAMPISSYALAAAYETGADTSPEAAEAFLLVAAEVMLRKFKAGDVIETTNVDTVYGVAVIMRQLGIIATDERALELLSLGS